MKRPLACFGFSLFTVLLCLSLVESTVVYVSLAILGCAAFAVSLIIKKSRQTLTLPTVFLASVLACLLLLGIQNKYNSALSFTGENTRVSGIITERPEFSRENRRYYCILKTDSINGAEVKTRLRLSFSETYDSLNPSEFDIGDEISFIATVYKAGSDSLSSNRYYKSRGIYLGGYSVSNVEIIKAERKPVSYFIDLLRQKITSALMHDFDNENASLLVALLTGDKDNMTDSLYDDFVKAGIVHIMAVSGLHLSIWVAFLSLFMDFRGKKGKLLAIVMIIFTVFMLNFASFTGSVKRASAMTILYFIGKIFGKKSDPLNSLGFAAVCALVPNPYGVLDVSFLLSFVSTMGIILMGVPLSERISARLNSFGEETKRLFSPLISTFALSVSVTFFIFPISVIVFGGISIVSPLSNVLCFIAVPPLLLMTGFYSLLRLIPFVPPFIGVIMKYLSSYIISVAEFVSELPFSYVNTNYEKLGLWFLIAFAFLFSAMLLYNYDRFMTKVFALISVGVFLLSSSVSFYTSLGRCKITVYGEEKGSCAVVSLNGRGALVGFDGNSFDTDEIAEYVSNNRIKIDCAFFHYDFVDKEKKFLCSRLGTEKILTADGTSAVLFDKVTITKTGNDVIIDSSDIKTEIFYKEYLQDDEKYDTIVCNDGVYTFSFREKNPYKIIVISSGGEKDG